MPTSVLTHDEPPRTLTSPRIMVVINSLGGGGAERVVQTLSGQFAARGYETSVVVFTARNQHYQLDPRVRLVDLGRRRSWNVLSTMMRLRRVVAEMRPDAVLSVLDIVSVQVGVAIMGMHPRPRLFVRECIHHSKSGTWLYRLVFRFLYLPILRTTDGIVCVSHGVQEDLQSTYGVSAAMLHTIYSPTDIEGIRQESLAPIEHPFIANRAAPLVVTCASMDDQKDYPTLLKALRLVNNQQPCQLLCIGEGPQRPELEQLARELKIFDRVSFVGRLKNPFPYLRCATVFVLSSHYEGMPNVVLEAIACGAPVVCSDCPSGPSEIVSHGETGLLVPCSDARALADAILRLLKNPDERRSMAERALRDIFARFAAETCASQYGKLLCSKKGDATFPQDMTRKD